MSGSRHRTGVRNVSVLVHRSARAFVEVLPRTIGLLAVALLGLLLAVFVGLLLGNLSTKLHGSTFFGQPTLTTRGTIYLVVEALVPALLLLLLVASTCAAAISKLVDDSLGGADLSWRVAFARGFRRSLSVFGASALALAGVAALIVVTPLLVAFGVAGLILTPFTRMLQRSRKLPWPPVRTLVLSAIPLAPALFWLVRWSLLVPVASLERRSPRQTLARSTELVRDRWAHAAGALGLLLAAYIGPQFTASFIGERISEGSSGVIQAALGSILLALPIVGLVVLFRHLVPEPDADFHLPEPTLMPFGARILRSTAMVAVWAMVVAIATVANVADPSVAQAATGGSISGSVLEDQYGFGIVFEGVAPPVLDAFVVLLDSNREFIDSQETGTQGEYSFAGLPAGIYTVEVGIPGRSFAPKDQGEDDTRDSDVDPETGRTEPLTVADGAALQNVDALAAPPGDPEPPAATGSVTGFLFIDVLADGVYEPTGADPDVPLADATVNLLDAGWAVQTTTTGSDGRYTLTHDVGDYEVEVVAPNPYHFSAPGQGVDPTIDSDVDAYAGRAPVTILADQSQTIDAGLTALRLQAEVATPTDPVVVAFGATIAIPVSVESDTSPLVPGGAVGSDSALFGTTTGSYMTAALVDGQATLTTSSTPTPGTYNVSVRYFPDGDEHFDTSYGTAQVIVVPLDAAVSLETSMPLGSTFGDSVTLQAPISTPDPASFVTSGATVNFYDTTNPSNRVFLGSVPALDTAPSLSLPVLDAGLWRFEADLVASDGSVSNTAQVSHTVSPAATSIALETTAEGFQQGTTATATITRSNVAFLPAGDLVFSWSGNEVERPFAGTAANETSQSLQIGRDSSGTDLSAGQHAITATFTPDDPNFAPSVQTITHSVSKAGATPLLEMTPAQVTPGQPTVFTVRMERDTYCQVGCSVLPEHPSGTITVSGLGWSGQGTLNDVGVATISATGLVGTDQTETFTATYGGDSNFVSSVGLLKPLTNKASVDITIASDVTAPAVGDTITLTATVLPQIDGLRQLPSTNATVTFRNGATILGTSSISEAGEATLLVDAGYGWGTNPDLLVGTQSLSATYDANAWFVSANTDAPAVVEVNTVTPTATMATPSASSPLAAITLTTRIDFPQTGPSPIGDTVWFMVDGNQIGNAPIRSLGVNGGGPGLGAVLLYQPGLDAGPHTVSSHYVGSTGAYEEATSPTLEFSVAQATGQVVLAQLGPAQPIPWRAGKWKADLQVGVFNPILPSDPSVAVESPSGLIQIWVDGNHVRDITLAQSGTATSSTPVSLTLDGPSTIEARYAGHGDVGAATKSILVAPSIPTRLGLAAALDDEIVIGETQTLRTEVSTSLDTPDGWVPTGEVTITSGETTCTGTVMTTRAVSFANCELTFSTLGAHPVDITYSGDGQYEAQTETTTVFVVLPTPDITMTSPGSVAGGDTFTVDWDVSGPLAGVATVSLNDQPICSEAALSGSCEVTVDVDEFGEQIVAVQFIPSNTNAPDGFAAVGTWATISVLRCRDLATDIDGIGAIEMRPQGNCADGDRYVDGTVVWVTAEPATGWTFDRFDTCIGCVWSAFNSRRLTVGEDTEVAVAFVADCVNLTLGLRFLDDVAAYNDFRIVTEANCPDGSQRFLRNTAVDTVTTFVGENDLYGYRFDEPNHPERWESAELPDRTHDALGQPVTTQLSTDTGRFGSILMDTDHHVDALFGPPCAALTVTAEGPGDAEILVGSFGSCDVPGLAGPGYIEDSLISIHPTPDEGAYLAGFTAIRNSDVAPSPGQVIDGDFVVRTSDVDGVAEAIFRECVTLTKDVTGPGSVRIETDGNCPTKDGAYAIGTVLDLVAEPGSQSAAFLQNEVPSELLSWGLAGIEPDEDDPLRSRLTITENTVLPVTFVNAATCPWTVTIHAPEILPADLTSSTTTRNCSPAGIDPLEFAGSEGSRSAKAVVEESATVSFTATPQQDAYVGWVVETESYNPWTKESFSDIEFRAGETVDISFDNRLHDPFGSIAHQEAEEEKYQIAVDAWMDRYGDNPDGAPEAPSRAKPDEQREPASGSVDATPVLCSAIPTSIELVAPDGTRETSAQPEGSNYVLVDPAPNCPYMNDAWMVGTVVTFLAAAPESGYSFTGWSGNLARSASATQFSCSGDDTDAQSLEPADLRCISVLVDGTSKDLDLGAGYTIHCFDLSVVVDGDAVDWDEMEDEDEPVATRFPEPNCPQLGSDGLLSGTSSTQYVGGTTIFVEAEPPGTTEIFGGWASVGSEVDETTKYNLSTNMILNQSTVLIASYPNKDPDDAIGDLAAVGGKKALGVIVMGTKAAIEYVPPMSAITIGIGALSMVGDEVGSSGLQAPQAFLDTMFSPLDCTSEWALSANTHPLSERAQSATSTAASEVQRELIEDALASLGVDISFIEEATPSELAAARRIYDSSGLSEVQKSRQVRAIAEQTRVRVATVAQNAWRRSQGANLSGLDNLQRTRSGAVTSNTLLNSSRVKFEAVAKQAKAASASGQAAMADVSSRFHRMTKNKFKTNPNDRFKKGKAAAALAALEIAITVVLTAEADYDAETAWGDASGIGDCMVGKADDALATVGYEVDVNELT